VDFLDFTKLLVRRWWISVPLLVVTVGLTLYTYTSVKPNYSTNAYVVLVPPAPTDNKPGQLPQDQRNVWLSQGLDSLANAASISVTEPTAATNLADQGYGSFTVTLSNGAAMVTFAVTGGSERQANATADELVRVYSASVKTLQDQAGAAPADQIQPKRLGAESAAVPSTGNVKRAAIAVFGAGLLTTAGITVAIDALYRRRARRHIDADLADRAGSGPALGPTGGLGGASPVSPAAGNPVPTRPSAARSDAVPTFHSLHAGTRPAAAGGRDTNGSTAEEVLSGWPRPAAGADPDEASEDAEPAATTATDVPTDVTVVLPLKIWSGRDAETGRRA
jgi:capsular polysaccharide biosynthesis protein